MAGKDMAGKDMAGKDRAGNDDVAAASQQPMPTTMAMEKIAKVIV